MTREIKVGESYLPEELWKQGYFPQRVIRLAHPSLVQRFGPEVVIYRKGSIILSTVNNHGLTRIVEAYGSDPKIKNNPERFISDFAESLDLRGKVA